MKRVEEKRMVTKCVVFIKFKIFYFIHVSVIPLTSHNIVHYIGTVTDSRVFQDDDEESLLVLIDRWDPKDGPLLTKMDHFLRWTTSLCVQVTYLCWPYRSGRLSCYVAKLVFSPPPTQWFHHVWVQFPVNVKPTYVLVF